MRSDGDFKVGDRVRYAGRDPRFNYMRGTVVEAGPSSFHVAGVLCSEFRVSVKVDFGDHTITNTSEMVAGQWRVIDVIERLAELGRA